MSAPEMHPPLAIPEHKKPFIDPVTGDPLSWGEHVSWMAQGIIRRWIFLGLITVATIVVWALDNPSGLVWWNLAASYLALLIEGTVGIAMFSQTRRDAVILREIRRTVERVDHIIEHHPDIPSLP